MAVACYEQPVMWATRERMAGGKAETQERILSAASRLFASRGYSRTSVGAIAQAAGVSRSAVFWHFGDKATLFEEVCKRMLVPFVQRLSSSYEHLDPAQQIFEIFSVYERFVAENRATIEAFVRWVLEAPEVRESLLPKLFGLQEIFTRKIERALTERLGDPKRGAELAAGLVSLLDGNLLLTLLDPVGESQDRRREGLLRLAELAVAHPEAGS